MIGTKLAHYEITSHLGTGGMGEVYQATDSKLGRRVAIKLLPDAFTHDTERASRFEQEARVLASLNHPNIAAIHGIEESGGRKFLVMELVPGETLAERIRRGPIPMEESLGIAAQITEALEAAHEKGVIHRDLKPANIKVTPEGKVKVLDFGLAKAFAGEGVNASLSNSPTLSLAATQQGIILGTAAYMSPEQAKGRPVDRRTDIFAFGCVMYEMLSGQPTFDGEDVTEILARVIERQPDWSKLSAKVPLRIRELLRLCLEKDPKKRRRDAADVRIDMEEAIAHPETETPSEHAARLVSPTWGGLLPWASTVIALVVAAVTAWVLWPLHVQPPRLVRLSTELGVNAELVVDPGPAVLLSPDGNVLAFTARRTADAKTQLYLRRLDQLQVSPLAGTEGARDAFFSPDGQWIGFFADGMLKKTSVTGGGAITLCPAPNDRGGTWADDGFIVFTPGTNAGLFRISSSGGTATPLTKLESEGESTHRWPQALPGSRAVLFTTSATGSQFDDGNVVVQSIPDGKKKVVQRGGYYGRYLPSGHLVFVHQSTLFAAPFDLNKLEMTAPPVPALEGLTTVTRSGGTQFAFSETGSIVYVHGTSEGIGFTLHWMGQDGKTQPLRAVSALYADIRFSPDGNRLAMSVFDTQNDVWVYDWTRDTMSRLTFDPTRDGYPVWSPDGRRIAFASQRGDKGTLNVYWQPADGTGEPQRLTESKTEQVPTSWHPSGKFLALQERNQQTNWDIMILPLEGNEASGWKPGEPTAFLASPFIETDAAFSPDGRWLAYQSNESGKDEIYVRPFPGPGGKWQISTGGGELATWSRTTKELFYRTTDQRVMVSSYSVEGDSFHAGKPRLWSEGTFVDRGGGRNFDIQPDGKRFAVLKAQDSQAENKLDKIIFTFNFFDELRRIAPVSKE